MCKCGFQSQKPWSWSQHSHQTSGSGPFIHILAFSHHFSFTITLNVVIIHSIRIHSIRIHQFDATVIQFKLIIWPLFFFFLYNNLFQFCTRFLEPKVQKLMNHPCLRWCLIWFFPFYEQEWWCLMSSGKCCVLLWQLRNSCWKKRSRKNVHGRIFQDDFNQLCLPEKNGTKG